MKNDQPVNNKVIAVSESNRQLSLPSEIVSRGIDLAARIESQRGIKKYQRPIRYFPGIHAPSCIDFSRNGRFAAITSYAGYDNADPDLLIWDVAYAKITIFSLREGGHNYGGYFFSVALSDSGDLAAVGYDDGGILCWDVRENILRDFRGKTYNTYGDAAVCTVFSPDEQQFAINIGYGARLYDSGSGEFIGDFRPHKTDANYYNQMVFSNDGRQLLIGSGQYSKFMKLLDVQGEREPTYFKNALDTRAVSIFPDQQRLLSLNSSGLITVWDATSGDEISHWSYSKTPSQVSDFCSEDQLQQLIPKTRAIANKNILLRCPFRSVDISSDGQRVLSGGGDKYMRLWTSNGMEICEFLHNTQVVKVAFLPNGQYALSGCWDGSVYLWELPE